MPQAIRALVKDRPLPPNPPPSPPPTPPNGPPGGAAGTVFRRAVARGTVPALHWHYYECVDPDPDRLQVWCYTDCLSYAPGETVTVHAATTAAVFDLTIVRDSLSPAVVLQRAALPGVWPDTPVDCSVRGCGWPAALRFAVPADWPSGGYVLVGRCRDAGGAEVVHRHLFLVRAGPERRAPRVLLAATSTWLAYNDWGGSNHYEGIAGPAGDGFSPAVSIERPWARGFVALPRDAPRIALADPPPIGAKPRYPHMEWAFAHGYSKKYASAGWASYERPFLRWMEGHGLAIDVVTQHDLDTDPACLDGYASVVVVGHDEYWSWAMRDGLDAYVDAGGRVARFAGNFLWQVRLEGGGRRQICHKADARETDPAYRSDDRHLTTLCWDAVELARPAALTMGLSGARGIYAGWGGCVPRGPGGFTVYRPEHWAFAGTDLYYGDVLGGRSRSFGYEVDGLDYVIRDGLPAPTGEDGAPPGIDILALGLAVTVEEDHGDHAPDLFIGTRDAEMIAEAVHGQASPAAVDRVRRGSGMIATYTRGRGEVFNAGSAEWVAGLIRQDAQVERVTANVLERYAARRRALALPRQALALGGKSAHVRRRAEDRAPDHAADPTPPAVAESPMTANPKPRMPDTVPAVDQQAFRQAMGGFVTGVTVVTAADEDGAFHGLTVSSFTSVSLDPPLVLFCLGKGSKSLGVFTTAAGFAVSVLAADQQPVAEAFAFGPKRWESLSLELWETGAPVIGGAVARLACLREAVYEGGDHVILVGRVVRIAVDETAQPLARLRGRYVRVDRRG